MARRKQYDNRFKAQVAIEAIKDERTMAQIASDYEVHPNQVRQWKRQILEQSPQLFANGHTQSTSDNDRLITELYRQIGQLKVELDWLQKKRECSISTEAAACQARERFSIGFEAMRTVRVAARFVLLSTRGGRVAGKPALYASD